VLGDSRFPQTTQFDMVRAFVMLAQMRVLPFRPDWRLDIVPADYVSKAIVHIHQAERPKYSAYNLSSGDILADLQRDRARTSRRRGTRSATASHRGCMAPSPARSRPPPPPRATGAELPASLLKVFLPYLTFNTVFDTAASSRSSARPRVPFNEYALGLLRFAQRRQFHYPYLRGPAAQVRQVA
jgi:hypothetical protein